MSDANPLLGEVEPTFWRLTKIYGSLFWRAMVIVTILSAFLAFLAHFIKPGHEYFEVMPTIMDVFSNPKLIPIYLMWLITLYGFECLVFRLIIGNKYSDFILTFVPNIGYKDANYWPTIIVISWAYYWRVTLVLTLFDVSEFIAHISQGPFAKGVIILEILASIQLLHYVVNKQYGKVRFSLIAAK